MAKFSSGFTDDDTLSQFPSAANPLTAQGIDPDEALANPEILERLNPMNRVAQMQAGADAAPPPGISAAGGTPTMAASEPPTPPSRSATSAGATGGAGAAAPPPSDATTTPATSAPTAPVPPSYEDYGRSGLDLLKNNLGMATSAADAIPTSNADVDRLTAQRERLATAPQLYSPTTGKMLPNVTEIDPKTGEPVTIDPRASKGTKIWRGIRGGLVGLLNNGIRGGLVGAIDPAAAGSEAYGAPNKAFERAEEQRTAALGATDKTLGDTFANWKQAVDAAKAKADEFSSNATLGKELTTGVTGMENAATDAQKVANEAALTPERIAAADNAAKLQLGDQEYQQRSARIADVKSPLSRLPASSKAYYLATGKLPDPRQATEGEIQFANATKVFTNQYGHPPQSLDELTQVAAAAKGEAPGGKNANKEEENESDAQAIVQEALGKRQEFTLKNKTPGGSVIMEGGAPAFEAGFDQFAKDANVKLAKLGYTMDTNGVLTRTGGNNQPSAAAAPTTQPSTKVSSGATVAVGQTVTDGKRTGTVTRINPKSKKPILRWNP